LICGGKEGLIITTPGGRKKGAPSLEGSKEEKKPDFERRGRREDLIGIGKSR